MPFSIKDFRTQLKYGGARPSLFQVELELPAGIRTPAAGNGIVDGAVLGNITEKIAFMCKASSIPASTVAPIEVPYFGRKIKVAGNRSFAEWQITVINDEDFAVRKAFELWLGAINGHESNQKNSGAKSSPATYQSSANVKQYGKAANLAIRSYQFVNCFPSEISPIELNWGTENEIEEFTVTLQYDYWVISSNADVGSPEGEG